jgi:transcription initiation factor IIE alpha subunit
LGVILANSEGEERKTIIDVVEERLNIMEEDVKKALREISILRRDVESIKKLLEEQFTISCPNCGNALSTWPIPYFMIKALHEVDAPDAQMKRIAMGVTNPQTDWKEIKVLCKKCEKIWHICYW